MKPDRLIFELVRKWLVVPSGLQRLQLFWAQLSRPLAQTNFAPPAKLLITDLVTKHDVAINEEFAGRCHFCFGAAPSTANLGIELTDLFIATTLCSLTKQMPKKSRSAFTDLTHSFLLARALLQRIEPDKCDNFLFASKPANVAQCVDQGKRRKRSNTRMCA